MADITFSFAYIPWFLVIFYALIPAAVYMFLGPFMARVYMIFSSFLGAIAAYAAPLGFLDQIIPPVIPPWVTQQLMGMASAILQYGLLIYAAAIFVVLFLLQHAIVKILDWTHWRGAHRHDDYGDP